MNFLSGCEEFIQVYRGLLLTKVAWRSQVWRGLVGSSVFQLPHHYCLVVLYILAHSLKGFNAVVGYVNAKSHHKHKSKPIPKSSWFMLVLCMLWPDRCAGQRTFMSVQMALNQLRDPYIFSLCWSDDLQRNKRTDDSQLYRIFCFQGNVPQIRPP